MTDNRYTPQTIDKLFTIPLYQRLFEWDEPQVKQLLEDLYAAFKKDSSSPYYIGMLTAFKGSNERYSLVDGQQRFTVLMLMGIVFGWADFLQSNGELRLTFFARKNDESYLRSFIDHNPATYSNPKIKAAIDCIRSFVEDKTEEKDAFINYIYKQATFFISGLPTNYSLQDLNRYFEAMNEAGKGLENHEILKVQLLKLVHPDKRYEYTRIWNAVSEMDKFLLKPGEQEKQQEYRNRNLAAFQNPTVENVLTESNQNSSTSTPLEFYSIKQIQPKSEKPQEKTKESGEQAILNFTDYLLQVLWLCLSEDKRTNATDFFKKNNLLATFYCHIKQPGAGDPKESKASVDIDMFFESLLRYRLLFDYYIIRLNSSDQRTVTYSLNQVSEEKNYEAEQHLIQYQSMLLVSTESHLWLTPYLEYLTSHINIDIEKSLNYLQAWDNDRHVNADIRLDYQSASRYWFWRLDFYLWQKRVDYFEDLKRRKIAGNYIFRANRSIEHIAPQQPKTQSRVNLDDEHLHAFGNLAMISSGQNSSLQNESFEVKRAHVESFINDSVGGNIQSLKMLKIYEFVSWNEENVRKHHNEMIAVLIDSFGFEKKYSGVIKQLRSQLFQMETETA